MYLRPTTPKTSLEVDVLYRFPPYTRILLVPSDDGSTHEYTISRRLLIALSILMVSLTVLFVLVVLSFTSLSEQAREVPQLQRELVETKSQLIRVQDLNRELEGMRDLQERLLTLLGVAPADSSGSGLARKLGETAGVIMTPPPSVWPLKAYVTLEYDPGDIPNGR